MIAIPAIDIREAACVQLVGGSYAEERVRLSDPRGVARTWYQCGFRRLHVIDLDAATSRGNNSPAINDLLGERLADVQVGGGVRTSDRVRELLNAGARYVIAGTRAIEEPAWLSDIAYNFPDRVILAADVRGRDIVTRGWERTLPVDVLPFVDAVASLPLAGVLVTAVHVEGQLRGPDLDLVDAVVARSAAPIIASGGIRDLDDLRELQRRGAAAAVIGMALYAGSLDARRVSEEFGG
jgi:phosphoribosylformimino-5-aminoimidazole carboxamide ribotide isomerase